jgi:hypothetical protein
MFVSDKIDLPPSASESESEKETEEPVLDKFGNITLQVKT